MNMTKLTDQRAVRSLRLLFAATYMISYITRINFGAIVSEMERATAISRELLSMALTGTMITYGVGQIVSGFIGDRVSPKKLVTVGLGVTVLINVLLPLFSDPYVMLVLWSINGFAQSFMWPPLVRLMSALLGKEDYKVTTVWVSWGSSVGTILIYLVSPLLISLAGWQLVFWSAAALGLVMLFVWQRNAYEIEPVTPSLSRKQEQGRGFTLLSPLMMGIMLPIALQGMLRDGVTTWMPSFITDTYDLSSNIAILTGVALPIFSILSFALTNRIHLQWVRNPVTCAVLFFGVGSAAACGVYVTMGGNAVLSVVFSALLTGCMHGVNLLLVCMLPSYFARFGKVSTVSGLLNSCTYVGSAVSTYGIALLSETKGWGVTVALWAVIAAAGCLLCLLCVRGWRRTFGTN